MTNKLYRLTFSYKSSREDDSVLVEAPSSAEAIRRMFAAWDPGSEIFNIKITTENVFQIVTDESWNKFNETIQAA